MSRRPLLLALTLVAGGALAQKADPQSAELAARLAALDANPEAVAAYERLQAHHAVDALAAARSRDRASALYVAQRRVETAEVAARTQLMQRDIDRLERERNELLVEASRQDAARARAEAERLRIQAQVQAEEAERLRQQAAAEVQAREQTEAVLDDVAGSQAARLNAAREKQAALAREEAELVAGAKLPASKRDSRGEVFILAGDAFASGQSTLTGGASASLRALAAYVKATPGASVRVTGYSDSQGAADANLALSQRRADAVRDALVAGGVSRGQVQAAGKGAADPVADNATASGRARNRRVEIVVALK